MFSLRKYYIAGVLFNSIFLLGCDRSAKNSSNVLGHSGADVRLSENFESAAPLNIPAFNMLSKDELERSPYQSRFTGSSDKPVLIYIANDSPEKLMQLAVKYELKVLLDICNSNKNANWIVFIGSLVAESINSKPNKVAHALTCQNGVTGEVPFPKFGISPDPIHKDFPFILPSNIKRAIKLSTSVFPGKDHQFFLTLKSHGADGQPLIALTPEQISKKNEAASKILKDFDSSFQDIYKIGQFDKAQVDSKQSQFDELALGQINIKNKPELEAFWNKAKNKMFSNSKDQSLPVNSDNYYFIVDPISNENLVDTDFNPLFDPESLVEINSKSGTSNHTGEGENTAGQGEITAGEGENTAGIPGSDITAGIPGSDITAGIGDITTGVNGKGKALRGLASASLFDVLLSETLVKHRGRENNFTVKSKFKLRFVHIDSCRNKPLNKNIDKGLLAQRNQAFESIWFAAGAMWYRTTDYNYIFEGAANADDFNMRFIEASNAIKFSPFITGPDKQ